MAGIPHPSPLPSNRIRLNWLRKKGRGFGHVKNTVFAGKETHRLRIIKINIFSGMIAGKIIIIIIEEGFIQKRSERSSLLFGDRIYSIPCHTTD